MPPKSDWNLVLNITLLSFVGIIFLLLIVLLILSMSAKSPHTVDEIVLFTDKNTDRSDGKISIKLKYRYGNVRLDFPDLVQIEEIINAALFTSLDLPLNSTWEKVARFIVHDIYEKFTITGTSIQIDTKNNESIIATKGYITGFSDSM